MGEAMAGEGAAAPCLQLSRSLVSVPAGSIDPLLQEITFRLTEDMEDQQDFNALIVLPLQHLPATPQLRASYILNRTQALTISLI